MPYFLETDDRDTLRKLMHSNVCASCGESLEMAYYPDKEMAGLVCRFIPAHEGIAKPNPKEDNSYEGGIKQMVQLEKNHGVDAQRALAKYQGVTSLSRVQAMEILDTIWPSAPQPDKVAAAILCQSYGLNPLANHIFLIPYEKKDPKTKEVISVTWSRVWGIRAKRLVASRKGGYSYLDMSPRLMTPDEQIKVWGKVDTANLCYVTILKDTATGAEAYGFGKWALVDSWGNPNKPKGTDKGNSMENMASIRSEAQALDRLRPAEMPTGFEDVTDERFVEVNNQTVEKTTGEVIEGEVVSPHDVAPTAQGEAVTAPAVSNPENDDGFDKMGKERDRIVAEEKWGFVLTSWLKESMKTLNWSPKDCGQWIERSLKVTGKTLREVVSQLNQEQAAAFVKEVQERLDEGKLI